MLNWLIRRTLSPYKLLFRISAFECFRLAGQFLLLGRQPALDFLHVFGRRKDFGNNAAIHQEFSNFPVVFYVFAGNAEL